MTTLRFTADLWRWEARTGWFFVTVAPEASVEGLGEGDPAEVVLEVLE